MTLLFFLTCIIVVAHASDAGGDDGKSLQHRLQPKVFPMPGDARSAMDQFKTALGIIDDADLETTLTQRNIEKILTYGGDGEDECNTKITMYGNLRDICIQEGMCPDINLLFQGDYQKDNPRSDKFEANLDDHGDIVLIHDGQSPSIQGKVVEVLKQIKLPYYYDSANFPQSHRQQHIMNIIGSVIVSDVTNPDSFIARGVCKPSSTSLIRDASMSDKKSLIKFEYKDCRLPQIFCMLEHQKGEGIWYLFPIWYELPHHHQISHDLMLPSYIKHCVAKTFKDHADLSSYRIEKDILFGILPSQQKTDT